MNALDGVLKSIPNSSSPYLNSAVADSDDSDDVSGVGDVGLLLL